jgi:phenylalanine-4-hydroxylase
MARCGGAGARARRGFDHLANRRFPAANFIRRANELDF